VQPVFQGQRIVPQYVRRCSPTFSAAFIAHVEATVDDEREKNALCEPVVVPEVPLDWLRMHLQTARNQLRWSQHADVQDWLRRSRLEAYTGLFGQMQGQPDPAWLALQARLRQARGPGLERMAALLGGTSGAPGRGGASSPGGEKRTKRSPDPLSSERPGLSERSVS
jgi:hypothetical protein